MDDNKILDSLSTLNQAIKDEFNRVKDRQQYCYLLVDRLGIVSELSLLYNESLADNIPAEWSAIIRRPELQHDLDSCPLLICLNIPNQPFNDDLFMEALIQIGEDYLTSKQYVCGFLFSALSPKQLADQLLDGCLLGGQALDKPYLPFYEPFLLDLLWHGYQDPTAHLGVLLPAETSYCFIDTAGNHQIFHSISYANNDDFSLHFTNQHVRAYFYDNNRLYHLIVAWLNLCKRQKRALSDDCLSQIIHYFYDDQATQFDDFKDRQVYVLFSLQYGELTRHDQLSELIHSVIEESDKKGQLGLLLSKETKALNELQNLK